MFFWEEIKSTTCFYKFFTEIYQKFLECRGPLFSSPKKKIYKNKKYLPTMSAKESALIPLVKNQWLIWKYNHHKYWIQNRSTKQDRRNHTLLLPNLWGRETPYNGSYYGRDPLLFTCFFEGASSYWATVPNTIILFISHYIAWTPLYSVTNHLRTF